MRTRIRCGWLVGHANGHHTLWRDAELVFQDVLWPDFGAAHLAEALAEYARRERRFGARPG